MAQAVGARLRGLLREEDSVLLEALVPTARLPMPPPRKAPAFGCPPPWDGREGCPVPPPGSLWLYRPRVRPLGWVGGHQGTQTFGLLGQGVKVVTLDPHSSLGWGRRAP